MMKTPPWTSLPFLIAVACAPGLPARSASPDGFTSIFDGKTLNGWHASAKTGHSSASQHKSGGRWFVEDGAIVGSQDIPGNGGILITDEQFGDYEVVLEMNNDFGPDSGLFLRSTEDGTAYQAMIDYTKQFVRYQDVLAHQPVDAVRRAIAEVDRWFKANPPDHPRVTAGARRWPEVEISGGINLETIRAYAETGPDWISVGALTHSAPALNLSLEIEEVG